MPPAEAGHVSLPVIDEEDARLARHVARTHGFADVEEVLSGRGIENVYAWLGAEAGDGATATGAEILEAAARGDDPRAEAAVRRFVRILGTVAGDLALLYLPFGGIYLIGGVARRFAPWFGPMGFDEAFCAKGRFSDYMRQFPVFVVNDDYAALAGCAAHLAELATRRRGSVPRNSNLTRRPLTIPRSRMRIGGTAMPARTRRAAPAEAPAQLRLAAEAGPEGRDRARRGPARARAAPTSVLDAARDDADRRRSPCRRSWRRRSPGPGTAAACASSTSAMPASSSSALLGLTPETLVEGAAS